MSQLSTTKFYYTGYLRNCDKHGARWAFLPSFPLSRQNRETLLVWQPIEITQWKVASISKSKAYLSCSWFMLKSLRGGDAYISKKLLWAKITCYECRGFISKFHYNYLSDDLGSFSSGLLFPGPHYGPFRLGMTPCPEKESWSRGMFVLVPYKHHPYSYNGLILFLESVLYLSP